MWAIGNLAGDSRTLRDMIIESGIINYAVAKLNDQNTINIMRKELIFLMSNLMRGKPCPMLYHIKNAVISFCIILAELDLSEFDFSNKESKTLINSAIFSLYDLSSQYEFFIKDLLGNY